MYLIICVHKKFRTLSHYDHVSYFFVWLIDYFEYLFDQSNHVEFSEQVTYCSPLTLSPLCLHIRV